MKSRRPTQRATARRNKTRPARAGRAAAARRAALRPALALPAECTLAEAEGLKLKLTGLLRNAKPVTLDLSAVRRIDTASMQLLAAFVRDRLAGDRAVALTAASPAFVEAAHLLGLSAALTGAGVAL